MVVVLAVAAVSFVRGGAAAAAAGGLVLVGGVGLCFYLLSSTDRAARLAEAEAEAEAEAHFPGGWVVVQ